MKKFLSILPVLAIAAFSCTKSEIPEIFPSGGTPSIEPEEEAVVFSAAMEGSAVTRTALSSAGDVYDLVWKTGDAICVNGITLNLQTAAQPDGYGPDCTKGNFSGLYTPTPHADSPLYTAIYPASLYSGGNYTLPLVQTYTADNISGFPMYAESDDTSLDFCNLCGIICIGLRGCTRSIATIALADVDDTPKPMSGRFTVVDGVAVISSGSNGTSLNCPTPVQLSEDDFTFFYLTVPAASYGKLRIFVTDSDGCIWTLTSKNAITVERSKITSINLSSPNFINERAQITYTTYNGSKIGKYAAGADASVFGDGLTVSSHSYDNGIGTITLSGDITRIGNDAFSSQTAIVSVTIPSTVTSIGDRAFRNLNRMTSCNIPETVTSIGADAYNGCTQFNPGADALAGIISFGAGAFNNTALDGELVIGSEVSAVGQSAFSLTKITSVAFEATPATLGTAVFQSCTLLESATIEGDISILDYMFDGCTALSSVAITGGTTSIGTSAFRNCSSLSALSLPSELNSIGVYAFSGCTALNLAAFPSCLRTIGNYAFKNCGITALPDGWWQCTYGGSTFEGCPIVSVTCPDGMTAVPANVCQNVKALETLNLGSSVTTVGNRAFEGCTALTSVTLSSTLTSLGDYAFWKCSSLATLDFSRANSLTSISFNCFSGCTSLTQAIFPQSLTSLGNSAFNGCTSLSHIEFPDPGQLTSIGANCFTGCSSLEAVRLPQSLRTLNGSVFSGCTALSSIFFPESATFTQIPVGCCEGCTSLTQASIPSNVTYVGSSAFKNCGFTALPEGAARSGLRYSNTPFGGCPIVSVTFGDDVTAVPDYICDGVSALEEVHFGSNVTTIGAHAFQNCSALTDGSRVAIPYSVTSIGDYCFYKSGLTTLPSGIDRSGIALGNYIFDNTKITSVTISNWTGIPISCFASCSELASVTLGEGVQSIANYGFYQCPALTSVALPSTLGSIGNYVFYDDPALTTLTLNAATPPTVGSNNTGLSLTAIYVPSSSVAAYQAAAWWSTYADIIQAIAD